MLSGDTEKGEGLFKNNKCKLCVNNIISTFLNEGTKSQHQDLLSNRVMTLAYTFSPLHSSWTHSHSHNNHMGTGQALLSTNIDEKFGVSDI